MSTKGNILRITLETTYEMREHIRVIPLFAKMAHVTFLEKVDQPALPGVEDDEGEEEEFQEEEA